MNPWVEKSIALANSAGYLDRLHEVYPVQPITERAIPDALLIQIREAHAKRNKNELLGLLFRLDRFPVNDPYVAFLKKNAAFVEANPKTVQRIANFLLSMPFEAIQLGIQQPKSVSRGWGNVFADWLKRNFPFLDEDAFKVSSSLSFLSGSGSVLKNFVNANLGYGLEKEPDFVARKGHRYVVGEAKFLSDFGGAQDRQLDDALSLLEETGKGTAVAVLDGVVWIETSNKMHVTVRGLSKPVLSSLLLKDFLESLEDK